jgi:hypothetical protein
VADAKAARPFTQANFFAVQKNIFVVIERGPQAVRLWCGARIELRSSADKKIGFLRVNVANCVSTGQFAGGGDNMFGLAPQDDQRRVRTKAARKAAFSRAVDRSPEPYAESMAARRRNPA